MSFERKAFEKPALLETHANVLLFCLRKQPAQPCILRSILRDVNDLQFLAGGEGLDNSMNAVHYVIEVEPSSFDSARCAQDDTAFTKRAAM